MGNLPVDDTRIFSSRFASKFGLNEAIFIEQLHYLEYFGEIKDGERWICLTTKEWHEQLPFFGLRTIERIIHSLKEKEIIIVGSYNKDLFNRTNWYRLNYDKLNSIWEE